MSEQAIVDAVRRRIDPKKPHTCEAQRITGGPYSSGQVALCRCGKDSARLVKGAQS